jgi:hypothetical protein
MKPRKAENTFMSRHQTAENNHSLTIANKCSKTWPISNILEIAVTNRSYSHEETKNRLNSVNTWYSLT